MRAIARASMVISVSACLVLALAPQAPAAAPTSAQKVERRLLNQERREVGRAVVRLDRSLSRVARRHSRVMAERDQLFHNPDLGNAVRGLRWSRLGENVGVAPNVRRLRSTLRALHDAFMASESHRRNVLLPEFRRVGVGVARANGKFWITIVFMG